MDWELATRLGAFVAVFGAMAFAEARVPLRAALRGRRWMTNLGLVALDSLLVRLIFPAAAVGAALHAEALGFGLFNGLSWPFWLECLLAFVILDFAIWAQHVAVHHIPLLWRLHRVHHADEAMDVTTGLRFHPLEILLSMALKIGLVYLLGAAALAVLLFEVALNAAAIWSHANITLPRRADRLLRLLVVTPDMHRSHHSVERSEHDSNFGFFLSVWDRLFKVWTDQPAKGQGGVEIGLKPWRDGRSAGFLWSLALPFRRRP